jgi:hypothetical protein
VWYQQTPSWKGECVTSSANDFGGESVTSVLISSDIDGEYLPRPNFVEPALNPTSMLRFAATGNMVR